MFKEVTLVQVLVIASTKLLRLSQINKTRFLINQHILRTCSTKIAVAFWSFRLAASRLNWIRPKETFFRPTRILEGRKCQTSQRLFTVGEGLHFSRPRKSESQKSALMLKFGIFCSIHIHQVASKILFNSLLKLKAIYKMSFKIYQILDIPAATVFIYFIANKPINFKKSIY